MTSPEHCGDAGGRGRAIGGGVWYRAIASRLHLSGAELCDDRCCEPNLSRILRAYSEYECTSVECAGGLYTWGNVLSSPSTGGRVQAMPTTKLLHSSRLSTCSDSHSELPCAISVLPGSFRDRYVFWVRGRAIKAEEHRVFVLRRSKHLGHGCPPFDSPPQSFLRHVAQRQGSNIRAGLSARKRKGVQDGAKRHDICGSYRAS